MRLPEDVELGLTVECPRCEAPAAELCVNVFNGSDIVDRVHDTRLIEATRSAKVAR